MNTGVRTGPWRVESTPAGYCLDPKFVKGIQLLGELGLSFDLCVRPSELPDMAKLVDQSSQSWQIDVRSHV